MTFKQRLCFATATFAFALMPFFINDASAVTDTIFRYQTPRNGWFSISPLAMTPLKSAVPSAFTKDSGQITVTEAACFATGVNLPHGAHVASTAVWYSNTTQGGFPEAALQRHDLGTGQVDEFAHGIFFDFSGHRIMAYLAVVDQTATTVHQKYDYSFMFCFSGPGEKFLGARIHYTYTDAGD